MIHGDQSVTSQYTATARWIVFMYLCRDLSLRGTTKRNTRFRVAKRKSTDGMTRAELECGIKLLSRQ